MPQVVHPVRRRRVTDTDTPAVHPVRRRRFDDADDESDRFKIGLPEPIRNVARLIFGLPGRLAGDAPDLSDRARSRLSEIRQAQQTQTREPIPGLPVVEPFMRSAVAPFQETAEFGVEMGRAGRDVVRNIATGSPDVRRATVGGGLTGAMEGPGMLLEAVKAAPGEITTAVRESSGAEKAGRLTGEALLLLLTGGAAKGVKEAGRFAGRGVRRAVTRDAGPQATRALLPASASPAAGVDRTAVQEAADRMGGLRFGRQPAPAVPQGEIVPRGTPTLNEALTDALNEIRATPGPSRTGLQPPPFGQGRAGEFGAGILRTSAPRGRVRPRAAQPAGRPIAAEPAGSAEGRLREQALDLRRMLGAEDAARELGIPVSRLREITPELTTVTGRGAEPMRATVARLDQDFSRRMERGASPVEAVSRLLGAGAGAAGGAALGETPEDRAVLGVVGGLLGLKSIDAVRALARSGNRNVLNGINAVRTEMALSGMAAPKNVGGAVGAPITAAVERASLAPLKEAARLPTNLREFIRGYRQPIDIGTAGEVGERARRLGPLRVFSRLISGIDHQAMQALKRAGVPDNEINRLLVRRPLTDFMSKANADTMADPLVRTLMLFQRTPANVFFGGLDEIKALGSGASKLRYGPTSGAGLARRRAATVGSAALGAGGAQATEDMPAAQRFALLGLLLAGAGVRALPMAMGATAAGAPQALREPMPISELGFDPRRIVVQRPSGLRVLEQLQGETGTQRSERLRRRRLRRRSGS